MPNSTENRGLTRRLQDWLYRNRASAAVWAGFVVFALLLAGGLSWGISWINERWFWGEEWFKGTGPWTFIVVIGGSPIAWFIWFVRDQNKAADIRIEDARNVQATMNMHVGYSRISR